MRAFSSRAVVFSTLSLVLATTAIEVMIESKTPALRADTSEQHDNTPESSSFAVVELFTSEGCSSCPPADENLRQIAKVAAQKKQKIYPLSFHVDYWNRLGWKDPFSQAAFSKRQQEYALKLDSDTYTPQMIVNGSVDFVGSNKAISDKSIRDALTEPIGHSLTLTLSDERGAKGQRLQYKIDPAGKGFGVDQGWVINFAIVTDAESVAVTRGENNGRKLSHAWVVKDLKTIPLDAFEGATDIEQKFVKKNHTKIVAYVQHQKSLKITGASAVDL